MGATEQKPGDDPASDDRADYDYQGGGVPRPAMVAELRERVDGDVRATAAP